MDDQTGSSTGDYDLLLRDVTGDDLPLFFQYQQDPTAVHMAAFTAQDPADRTAFDAHWAKILADESVLTRAILVDGQLAGHVASFEMFGQREVTYWIGREFWGRGVATRALQRFLTVERTRPLYARAAHDNIGSIRVLRKCGFTIYGQDKGYAHARGQEIAEFVLVYEHDADLV